MYLDFILVNKEKIKNKLFIGNKKTYMFNTKGRSLLKKTILEIM
ncbi:hypothetical protein [Blattabacterium cuenoti]|nr:hypothetical protein [Blattabacterium cuenoti]